MNRKLLQHIDITTHAQSYANSTDNVTQSPLDNSRDEGIAVIEVAVSATILFLAVAGNGCVLASLYMRKRRRLSRMQLMILHLSLADLFVAFFNVLPQLVWDVTFRFQGGGFLCKLVKYLQVVAMYASAYVLLATATDRYLAICHPFLSQSWTPRHAHLIVGLAWIASLLLSLPQVFIFSLTKIEDDVYDCWAHFDPEWTLPAYITWTTLSIFVVPTCVLVCLYGRISWVVWKAGRLNTAPGIRGKALSTEKMESVSSSCTTTSHSVIIVNNNNKNTSIPYTATESPTTTTSTGINHAAIIMPTRTSVFYSRNGGNNNSNCEKSVTRPIKNCNRFPLNLKRRSNKKKRHKPDKYSDSTVYNHSYSHREMVQDDTDKNVVLTSKNSSHRQGGDVDGKGVHDVRCDDGGGFDGGDCCGDDDGIGGVGGGGSGGDISNSSGCLGSSGGAGERGVNGGGGGSGGACGGGDNDDDDCDVFSDISLQDNASTGRIKKSVTFPVWDSIESDQCAPHSHKTDTSLTVPHSSQLIGTDSTKSTPCLLHPLKRRVRIRTPVDRTSTPSAQPFQIDRDSMDKNYHSIPDRCRSVHSQKTTSVHGSVRKFVDRDSDSSRAAEGSQTHSFGKGNNMKSSQIEPSISPNNDEDLTLGSTLLIQNSAIIGHSNTGTFCKNSDVIIPTLQLQDCTGCKDFNEKNTLASFDNSLPSISSEEPLKHSTENEYGCIFVNPMNESSRLVDEGLCSEAVPPMAQSECSGSPSKPSEMAGERVFDGIRPMGEDGDVVLESKIESKSLDVVSPRSVGVDVFLGTIENVSGSSLQGSVERKFLLGENLAEREKELRQSWSKCNLITSIEVDGNADHDDDGDNDGHGDDDDGGGRGVCCTSGGSRCDNDNKDCGDRCHGDTFGCEDIDGGDSEDVCLVFSNAFFCEETPTLVDSKQENHYLKYTHDKACVRDDEILHGDNNDIKTTINKTKNASHRFNGPRFNWINYLFSHWRSVKSDNETMGTDRNVQSVADKIIEDIENGRKDKQNEMAARLSLCSMGTDSCDGRVYNEKLHEHHRYCYRKHQRNQSRAMRNGEEGAVISTCLSSKRVTGRKGKSEINSKPGTNLKGKCLVFRKRDDINNMTRCEHSQNNYQGINSQRFPRNPTSSNYEQKCQSRFRHQQRMSTPSSTHADNDIIFSNHFIQQATGSNEHDSYDNRTNDCLSFQHHLHRTNRQQQHHHQQQSRHPSQPQSETARHQSSPDRHKECVTNRHTYPNYETYSSHFHTQTSSASSHPSNTPNTPTRRTFLAFLKSKHHSLFNRHHEQVKPKKEQHQTQLYQQQQQQQQPSQHVNHLPDFLHRQRKKLRIQERQQQHRMDEQQYHRQHEKHQIQPTQSIQYLNKDSEAASGPPEYKTVIDISHSKSQSTHHSNADGNMSNIPSKDGEAMQDRTRVSQSFNTNHPNTNVQNIQRGHENINAQNTENHFERINCIKPKIATTETLSEESNTIPYADAMTMSRANSVHQNSSHVFSRANSINQKSTEVMSRVDSMGQIRTEVKAQASNQKTISSTRSANRCFSPCISRAKLKTIKLTLTVVICYVICWLPFFVGQLWAAYDENAPFQGNSFAIILLLASVNSCTNPWIYTIFSNTICRHARSCISATAAMPSQLIATTQNATETLASKMKIRN